MVSEMHFDFSNTSSTYSMYRGYLFLSYTIIIYYFVIIIISYFVIIIIYYF